LSPRYGFILPVFLFMLGFDKKTVRLYKVERTLGVAKDG